MGKLLSEKNLRDVWCRNENVRAEIGPILHTHTHTHTRVSYCSIDEGETGRVPIFSIPRLSVGIFMKLGFVTIDRNESQKLKCKLLNLLIPQEKKKQVA